MGEIHGVVRAKKPQKLPVVLTQKEVQALLRGLAHMHWLIACLQYGSGLRLMESIRLRIKDLDFYRRAIYVRNGKGGKDRFVTLAEELIIPLQRHLQSVRTIHERDLEEGYGRVYLPYALERKYPKAPEEWAWLYAKPIYNVLRVAIHFAIMPHPGHGGRFSVDGIYT